MDDPMVARVSAAAGVPDLVERLATSVSAGDLEAFLLDLARLTLAAFAGAMVPVIAALALVSDAGSHASDAFFVAGASFVSIAFTILGVAVTTWMVGSAAHELEQWRGRPHPLNPQWSFIEGIDCDGAHIEDEQAEHGYWGVMEGEDAPIGALGEDAEATP